MSATPHGFIVRFVVEAVYDLDLAGRVYDLVGCDAVCQVCGERTAVTALDDHARSHMTVGVRPAGL